MLEHGGRLRGAVLKYGIDEADWLDLSSGISPWSWPIPAISEAAWSRLPETDDGLEAAARRYYGATDVLPVAGSQAAIQALPRLRQAGKVGVLSPCYAEHAEAWRNTGFLLREVLEQEVERFIDTLDVLVVVNPNNPTGLSLPPERLLEWHARLAQRGAWLVVDEAFMDNTPELSLAAYTQRAGLIVLRSFGKFFGLAGVRLGFVLAEPRFLKVMARQIGPWSVSGPTRIIGQSCLNDVAGHQRQRQRTEQASQRLVDVLNRHGFAPKGGCALFQWLITPLAEELYAFCAQRGILLRIFTHNSSLRFGLPREDADWQRLEQALSEFSRERA
ncbi:threonine-phosphate decarboxylase CobD [Pseudomonas sp. KU26590]|uniref:threonine-phosphate decarboxylase CobD n=1 Tax=Pseudomonas sp. KU26590 TaxID=2991051 RepID=UPI00223E78E6|nr:threonine-phosphate decarboxylase CobD [Pseudomonas sp. KU26590]UZJ61809.1 threonine-phosphate decarboxylase CobD [Pseudomonas sp. KU26590]